MGPEPGEEPAGGMRGRKELVLSARFHAWVTGVEVALVRARKSARARLELTLGGVRQM